MLGSREQRLAEAESRLPERPRSLGDDAAESREPRIPVEVQVTLEEHLAAQDRARVEQRRDEERRERERERAWPVAACHRPRHASRPGPAASRAPRGPARARCPRASPVGARSVRCGRMPRTRGPRAIWPSSRSSPRVSPSTRLPGKPLSEIHGKTMVQRVYERARAATRVDRVLVATDDERIARGRARLRRRGGDDLAATTPPAPTGWPRPRAGIDAEIVVNVQGDEPLRRPRRHRRRRRGARATTRRSTMATLSLPLARSRRCSRPRS